MHQVIDGRVGGAGVKRQQGPIGFGQRQRRIYPRQVSHPAKVQKGDRSGQPRIAGAGVMKERRERCALSAQLHVGTSKIPNYGQSQMIGQRRTIADLQRALHTRRMGQRLTVKTDQINVGVMSQCLEVRGFDHLRSGRHLRPRPFAETGRDGAALCLGIAAIA